MPRQVGSYQCVVAFYEAGKEFDWMANTFRNRPVTIDGEKWPTSEQYFQAQKYPDLPSDTSAVRKAKQEYRKKIREFSGSFKDFPKYAKDLALGSTAIPNLPPLNVSEWDGAPPLINGRKHAVMLNVIREKMKQHPDLAAQLDALPGDAIIVEATDRDDKWGDKNDGTGTNHLGILYKALLLERRNVPTAQALQRAYDEYQQFNQLRRGYSLYSYPEVPVPQSRTRAAVRPQPAQSAPPQPSAPVLRSTAPSLSMPAARTSQVESREIGRWLNLLIAYADCPVNVRMKIVADTGKSQKGKHVIRLEFQSKEDADALAKITDKCGKDKREKTPRDDGGRTLILGHNRAAKLIHNITKATQHSYKIKDAEELVEKTIEEGLLLPAARSSPRASHDIYAGLGVSSQQLSSPPQSAPAQAIASGRRSPPASPAPAPSFSSDVLSAEERWNKVYGLVGRVLASNGLAVRGLYVDADQGRAGEFVVKITFDSKADAQQFTATYSGANTIYEDETTIVLGKARAPQTFIRMGLSDAQATALYQELVAAHQAREQERSAYSPQRPQW